MRKLLSLIILWVLVGCNSSTTPDPITITHRRLGVKDVILTRMVTQASNNLKKAEAFALTTSHADSLLYFRGYGQAILDLANIIERDTLLSQQLNTAIK